MDQQRKARKVIEHLEEYKSYIKPPKQVDTEEARTEMDYCRKYSKTRSMGQD